MTVRIRSAPPYGFRKLLFHLFMLLWLACAAPAVAAERLILALGDSLTAGYQLPADASFPAQLQAALRKDNSQVRVHNAGVSGDTSAQGKARLAWMLNSLKQKPDLAIVALGANDMLRGQKVSNTQANLDAILGEFHRREIPVILAGMRAAPNMGQNYVRQYEALFPALAKKYDAALYPFFLDGVAANPELQLADGMHPNRAGVARMVSGILPLVRSELDRLSR